MTEINDCIKFSLALNQSKTNRIQIDEPDVELRLARKSKDDVVLNIMYKHGTYFVVFRGSRADNWDTNLRIKQQEIPYFLMYKKSRIKVHRGFKHAYISVRTSIALFFGGLHNTGYNNIKIICTGHSLGGALATLCALDLKYWFKDTFNISCITLGSPRVGNWAFARSYNKRVPNTTRIVHGNDIVARLPPAWLNYKHVGKRMHQGNKWKFWLLPWGSLLDHLKYEEFK